MEAYAEIADWLVPFKVNKYKVRLAKLEGKGKAIRLGETIEGYVKYLPKTGQRFNIYTKDGRVFRTSAITNIGSGYIKTCNSTYKLELI
jgi:hypothetical protein